MFELILVMARDTKIIAKTKQAGNAKEMFVLKFDQHPIKKTIKFCAQFAKPSSMSAGRTSV